MTFFGILLLFGIRQGLVNVPIISTSPNYWGYKFQQIFQGDVKQIPPKGTFTTPCQMGSPFFGHQTASFFPPWLLGSLAKEHAGQSMRVVDADIRQKVGQHTCQKQLFLDKSDHLVLVSHMFNVVLLIYDMFQVKFFKNNISMLLDKDIEG